jgi:hypothetical protein
VKSFGSHVAAVSGSCQRLTPNLVVSSPTAHVCELLAAALEIVAVLRLDGVLNSRGHRVICGQDGTLNKLDLTGHTTLKAASGSDGTTGLLALSPGLGGASLAPRVWRGCAVGSAKLSSRLIAASRRVDVRPVVYSAGILCGTIARVCLRQTVGRVWAVLRMAVEGVVVRACCILVQERATDLLFVVPAGSVLSLSLASPFCYYHHVWYAGARGSHALRCYGLPHSFAGCTP